MEEELKKRDAIIARLREIELVGSCLVASGAHPGSLTHVHVRDCTMSSYM